jgi:hypothetical protein
MPALSLHEIEEALCTLWMNRRQREAFLDNSGTGKKGKKSTGDLSLSPELSEKIDRNGIRLYAQLLNIGHQDLMENVFPGCARLIGDKWTDVVDDYLEKFPPSHFNLNRSAEKFSQYLAKWGERYVRKYPFIVELADYEWLELELLEHPALIEVYEHTPLSSPEQCALLRPVVNPVLAIRRYKYPITAIVEHLEDNCCIPKDAAPNETAVAVFRDPESHSCRFLEIGEMTARIVEVALESPTSYKDLIELAVASGGMDPQQCVIEFLSMVEKLQEVRLLVGSQALTV